MTRWFGEPWPRDNFRAPVCADDADKVPTPVGTPCEGCGQAVAEDDNGVIISPVVPFHRECILRHVLGCSSALNGGPHDHDGDYREDARRVEDWLAQNPGG